MRKNYYEDLTSGISPSNEDKRQLIFENWANTAKDYGDEPDATIRDLLLRKLNTAETCKFIQNTDRIIDIGCGNGFATKSYASCADSGIGVDYIPAFVEKANEINGGQNLQFLTGDILDLSSIKKEYGEFDKVIAERTLINLVSWDDQKKAIGQLDSLLRPGGLLILTEVTIQGHESIDNLREKYGLSILEKHWNNVYIDENMLLDHLSQSSYGHGVAYELIHKYTFGFYSLVSKVLYPYMIYPDEPSFDSRINKAAAELEFVYPIDNLGHQRLFVFRKNTNLPSS